MYEKCALGLLSLKNSFANPKKDVLDNFSIVMCSLSIYTIILKIEFTLMKLILHFTLEENIKQVQIKKYIDILLSQNTDLIYLKDDNILSLFKESVENCENTLLLLNNEKDIEESWENFKDRLLILNDNVLYYKRENMKYLKESLSKCKESLHKYQEVLDDNRSIISDEYLRLECNQIQSIYNHSKTICSKLNLNY
tara:strand:- start:4718 stop:5305 length:588 start_codon:yes stop_codon:yes gene_type:complete